MECLHAANKLKMGQIHFNDYFKGPWYQFSQNIHNILRCIAVWKSQEYEDEIRMHLNGQSLIEIDSNQPAL